MGLHLGLTLGNAQPVGPASSITIDTAPAITGTAEVGETLTRTVGSYSGDGAITVSNGRWTRNGVDIAGATGATYTLVAADDQTTVRWYEDVADAGSGDTITAQSNGLYVTYAAPVEDAAPTASGDAVIGESLTGTSGTFTGSDLTESDEWQISDDGSTGWTGTGDTDTTSPAQVSGKYYRFASTAENSGGSLTTYSNVIGPAIAPTISMSGLTSGDAIIGDHASITMSANIGTITARKWGSTSGGSQFGTGTNPTDFTGSTTLYGTSTVGGIDYTISAPIAEAAPAPVLSGLDASGAPDALELDVDIACDLYWSLDPVGTNPDGDTIIAGGITDSGGPDAISAGANVIAFDFTAITAGTYDLSFVADNSGTLSNILRQEITLADAGTWAITGSDNTLTVTDQPTAPTSPTITGGELTLNVTG